MEPSSSTEEWRDVAGYEGRYRVSNQGRVKGLTRGRILNPWTKNSGHLTVELHRPGGRGSGGPRDIRFVHSLVLEAFVGPRPDGLDGCHNNGIPSDNRAENLRWDTRSENTHDKVRHGTHFFANKTHCPQDHPYNAQNTRLTKTGARYCIQCKRDKLQARNGMGRLKGSLAHAAGAMNHGRACS